MTNQDDTRIYQDNLNEETRTQDNEQTIVDEPINPAAPVSKKAASGSKWASRLGFAAAGAVAGFAAGYAASADASGVSTEPKLAPAADPDNVEPQDSIIAEDPNDLSNNLQTEQLDQPEQPAIEIQLDDEVVAGTNKATADVADAVAAATHTAHAAVADEPIAVQIEDDTTGEIAAQPYEEAQVAVEYAEAAEAVEPVEPVEAVEPAEPAAALEGSIPQASDVILSNENGIHYAQVDDSMSFAEAFATARQQVGAPGVFVWHGNTYGTYYAEEWNDMSADERGDFLAKVDFPEDLNREAEIATEMPDDQLAMTADVHDDIQPQVTDDVDFQMLEIDQHMDADGNVTTIGHMQVNGVDVYLGDSDGDNIMDEMLIDTDGDGKYTAGTDAILPITDQGITTNDMVEAITDIDSMDSQLPTDDLAQVDFDPNAPADF